MNTREIINARTNTHGDYTDHARVAQELKLVMRAEQGWRNLNTCQRESLEMFAHKIARILVGNPHFKDHWDDIAGYAILVADRVKPVPTPLMSDETFLCGTPDDGGHHARQNQDD